MSPTASVNRTGFVDAEPASKNDMFMSAPKKAATPVRMPRIRPTPMANLAEGDHPREPALVIAREKGVDEIAIPLVRDRRPTLLRDRGGPLPISSQRGPALGPPGIGELMPSGLEPSEADEESDRKPEQARAGVVEQESGESWSFDLDLVRVRVPTRLQIEDYHQGDRRNPEGDGHELSDAIRNGNPRIRHPQQQDRGDDPKCERRTT